MLINLEAMFDSNLDAYNAARTADVKFYGIETKVFDKWSLQSYLNNVYTQKFRAQVIQSLLIGGVLGTLFAVSIKLIFNLENLRQLTEIESIFSFGIVGFIISAILLMTLLFIKREDVPNLSIHDIKRGQSLAVFKFSPENLKTVESILANNNALKVKIV